MPAVPSSSTPEVASSSSNATSSPAFDPKEVTVIFVLGGPGAGASTLTPCVAPLSSARVLTVPPPPPPSSHRISALARPHTLLSRSTGKGTQCAKLVQDYGFVHLSGASLSLARAPSPLPRTLADPGSTRSPCSGRPPPRRASSRRLAVRRHDQGVHHRGQDRPDGGHDQAPRERHARRHELRGRRVQGGRRRVGRQGHPRTPLPRRRLPAPDGPGRQVRRHRLPLVARPLPRVPGNDPPGAPPRARKDVRPRRRQRGEHQEALRCVEPRPPCSQRHLERSKEPVLSAGPC